MNTSLKISKLNEIDFQTKQYIWKGTATSERYINGQKTLWKNIVLHFELRNDGFPIYSVFGCGHSLFNRRLIPFIIQGTFSIDHRLVFRIVHV